MAPVADGVTFFECVSGVRAALCAVQRHFDHGRQRADCRRDQHDGISIVAVEVKSAPTLSAQSLSGYVNTTAIASGAITPAGRGAACTAGLLERRRRVVTIAVTDTSGLGLMWTEQKKQNTNGGDGYTGIWTTTSPGILGAPATTAQSFPYAAVLVAAGIT